MNLLGPYPSNLATFYYQELLAILQTAVASGAYAGGVLFDTAAAAGLQAEGTDFSSLPVISSGTRAVADQINTPMGTLLARFNALMNESQDFQTRLAQLLTVIDKDSYLVEQNLAAALGSSWATAQPTITGAIPFSWDFAAGYGPTAINISPVDPTNGVVYSSICPLNTISNNGSIISGLVTPYTSKQLYVKNLVWNYTFQGQTEIISGDNWSQLSYLAPSPLLIYAPVSIGLILPTNLVQQVLDVFVVTGQGTAGNLPVYVQMSFTPRTSTVKFTADQTISGSSLQLSSYRISGADVVVYDSNQTYALATDYTLDVNNNVLPNDIIVEDGLTTGCAGRALSIQFIEYFPSYQCSVNQIDWSSPVMLDPARLFPDGSTVFTPIPIQTINGITQYPVTDELGTPLGYYLARQVDVNSNPIVPVSEMLFSVTSPVAQAAGARTELVAELELPSYLTGFNLEPFTSFPVTLVSVFLEGFSNTIQTPVISEPILLTTEMKITFPTTLVRKIHLNFIQENYTLEEITIQPPDSLDVILSITYSRFYRLL